jgi:dihydrofolate reductase
MGEVVFDMSMSLDGFITGPTRASSIRSARTMDGSTTGSDRKTAADAEVLDEMYAPTGAIIMGKRIFDLGVGPWGDPPPFHMPVFVVTHEARERWSSRGGTTCTS